MKALNSTTLQGLWAAVPTPWDAGGQLATDLLMHNCARLAEAQVDGIYTTDSDGEFYAIELPEFQRLAKTFGKAMEAWQPQVPAAMGVTWCNTQGTIDRIKASLDAGIANVHVAFPFFMPLAAPDVDRFFDDLAAATPSARWIHYAHPQCGPTLTGHDYARLHKRFPDQFIGTKLGTSDMGALVEILLHAPDLAHFVVDPTLLTGMLLGARGCYSYWCNTLPGWHRRYMDACLHREWDQARSYHLKLLRFELDHIAPLRAQGHRHAIISKARAALSEFLEDNGMTRPPYYPVAPSSFATLKQAFKKYWKEELTSEEFTRDAGATRPGSKT